ncbi:hypothetical protein [Syntrophus gentianae]|uniref:hypothetical protein n=1 Tax=Syntrophus gentianae TaxID=43775 RepID=UPI0011146B81|nr:hypothetical protein [Syntrophus gentianae]
MAHQVDAISTDNAIMSAPKAGGGERYKNSETSRLLCAAAYLDRQFRNQVIKFCLEDKHRAIGPSFGVDMATVVRHCRNAKRKLDSRELWLLLPAMVAVIVVANSLQVEAFTYRTWGILLALYLVTFAICLWFKSRARTIVTSNFLRGRFDPDTMLTEDDTPVGYLRAAETGNVVIYSGFTPFVGSGENMGGWSFAMDLSKRADSVMESSLSGAELTTDVPITKEAIAPKEVSLEALYACVARAINGLQLDRVTIEDKLYINGQDIRDDKRFLEDPLARPLNQVDEQAVTRAMLEQSEKQLRHYRCVRVVDWSGEMVLSIFLRFSKLSYNLFVEASYFLLTPVGERFRQVDSMSPHFSFGRFFKMLVFTAVATPFVTLYSPFVLLGRIQERIQRWSAHRQEKKQILDNPTFDYGASFSFRQWASPHEYRRYFQRLDKEMYFKVLEKNILDSILTFLEENNVDVSELKQRQSMILNNGLILSGGSMTAENLSVGAGAKVETVKQKVSQFAAKAVAAGKQSN